MSKIIKYTLFNGVILFTVIDGTLGITPVSGLSQNLIPYLSFLLVVFNILIMALTFLLIVFEDAIEGEDREKLEKKMNKHSALFIKFDLALDILTSIYLAAFAFHWSAILVLIYALTGWWNKAMYNRVCDDFSETDKMKSELTQGIIQ